MTHSTPRRIALVGILSLVALIACSTAVFAQVKVQGIIKGRSGATIILETAENPKLVVVLSDSTQVAEVQGLFKARSKNMSMAALIPGLPVQVEGSYDANQQLDASSVKFKGNDFEQAQAIQAGVHETQQAAAANQAELEKQNAELAKQNAALTEVEKKTAANKAAIAANTARFGQLDDYNIWDEVTIYFANGQTKIDPKYNSQLLALAEKASTVTGYMIQVKGYASATGSAAVNQRLSEERADNVVDFMQQQGHIPLTNMLAPGAMGESRQIDTADSKSESEAQNRRVVVRVLQNKGIAGT